MAERSVRDAMKQACVRLAQAWLQKRVQEEVLQQSGAEEVLQQSAANAAAPGHSAPTSSVREATVPTGTDPRGKGDVPRTQDIGGTDRTVPRGDQFADTGRVFFHP